MIKVDVTKEMIVEAESNHQCKDYYVCTQCVLAVALRYATGKTWSVSMGSAALRHASGASLIVSLPSEAVERRQAFDGRRHVGPFSFNCEIRGFGGRARNAGVFKYAIRDLAPDATIDGDVVTVAGKTFTIREEDGYYVCN